MTQGKNSGSGGIDQDGDSEKEEDALKGLMSCHFTCGRLVSLPCHLPI